MSFIKKSFHTMILLAMMLVFLEGASYLAGLFLHQKGKVFRPHVEESYASFMSRLNPVLGWPSQASFGQRDLDLFGSRIIPAFPDPEKSKACVSLYGNSFTWSEETDNEHAWSNVLARLLNCRVANYGVGGYGADQSYLRFHNRRNDTGRVVIMGFSTENIRRSVNQCRNLIIPHSQCGLKPRFILDDQGELQLVPIPFLTEREYQEMNQHPEKYLKYDFFTPGEASGIPRLQFPYTLTVLQAFKHLFFDTNWREPAYAAFYRPDHPSGALQVTAAILETFAKEARSSGKYAVILFVPLIQDFDYYQKNHRWIFQPLIDELHKNGIETLNAGQEMLEYLDRRKPAEIYSKGGHFTQEGYQLVGTIVYKYLILKDCLSDKKCLVTVGLQMNEAGFQASRNR